MQTSVPSTLPVSQPVTPYLSTLPDWLQLAVGFLMIGIGAALLTSQFRQAFPPNDDPKKKALHYLYPSVFGASIAELAPFALPGFGFDSRWLIGLVAPYLWAPLYDYLRKRYLKDMGTPSPTELLQGGTPPLTPAPPVTTPQSPPQGGTS